MIEEPPDEPRPLGCADWVLIGLVLGAILLACGWWFVTLMDA